MARNDEGQRIAQAGPLFDGDSARKAVIKVGTGRGFVIELEVAGFLYKRRLVVTAAHCLSHLPPACSSSGADEKTYAALLGPLGDSAPSIMAECLFADPVADIAILGGPDDQTYFDENDAFEALTEGATVLRHLGARQPGEARRPWRKDHGHPGMST